MPSKKAKTRKATKRPSGFHFTIQTVIYPAVIVVSFQETDDQVLNALMQEGAPPSIEGHAFPSNQSAGRCVSWDTGINLIRMRHIPTSPEHLALLNHETLHATQIILESLGMPLTMESAEAYTYFLQYVSSEIYTVLMKKKILSFKKI